MMRALKYIALLAAALAVVGLSAAYLSLNSLVKKAVETVAPEVTKTTVTVDRVSLLPFSGSGSLHGLAIGNPKGYRAANAFSVGKIRIALEPKSLLTNTVVVRSVEVIDPQIDYEGTLNDSNLTRLQKNVESFTGPSKKAAGPPTPAKKVIIDDFKVTGGKVTVDVKLLAQGKPLIVALPDIHLTGIGRKGNGASIKDAATQIFGTLTPAITKAVAQPLAELTKNFGGVGKNIQGILGGLFGRKK